MNPYAMLSSGIGTTEGTALSTRLTAWHDAMVAHERRQRAGRTQDACDDECPHVEARTLWAEALETLGPRAHELGFLRSHALAAAEGQDTARRESSAELSDRRRRTGSTVGRSSAPGRQPSARSSDQPPAASAEL
jgi:hypothetical protein